MRSETKPSCSQELLQNGAGGFLLHYGLAAQLNISAWLYSFFFFFFKCKLFCTHSPLKQSPPSSLSAVSGEGGVTVLSAGIWEGGRFAVKCVHLNGTIFSVFWIEALPAPLPAPPAGIPALDGDSQMTTVSEASETNPLTRPGKPSEPGRPCAVWCL